MPPAPIPKNEDERLTALQRYQILDTLPELVYDDIVLLASEICATPIALVSLVDSDRQWFKAKVGVDASETHRDMAFCAHAILDDKTLVVKDATDDTRFLSNPLVQDDPNIRFYAGAPLRTPEGLSLGTLCVIDRKPRDLPPAKLKALEALGRQIEAHLEARLRMERLTAAHESLTASEERYRDLFLHASDLVQSVLPDGRFDYVNPAWHKTLGYSSEEIADLTIFDIIPPDGRGHCEAMFKRVMSGENLQDVETVFVAKDGRSIHLQGSSSCRFENGVPVSTRGVFHDITHSKQREADLVQIKADLEAQVSDQIQSLKSANEQLRKSEARYLDLYHSAPDMFVSVDPRTATLVRCNRTTCQNLGYEESELLGRSIFDIYSPKFHPQVRDILERFRATGSVRDCELQVLSKDGRAIDISLSISAIRDEQGEIIYSSAVWRDISARKRAERAVLELNASLEARVEKRTAQLAESTEELLEAKEAAEAANRAKSEFLANMSHEIRTPMNGVIGLAEILETTELNPEQRSFLDGVKHSADDLLRIINDILDFSKIEAGKMDLVAEPFELRGMVERTIKGFSAAAAKKGVELALEIDPATPNFLNGDHGRLRQILINLIGNAVKFTETGEIHVTLAPENPTEDDDGAARLQFCVQDTGLGIPDNQKTHIFESFTQVDDSITRSFGGTGLGLAISAQLVELMDGRIWVESEPNKGSRFHFTARFKLGAPAEASASPAPYDALKGMRVLIVDDNATNRRILAATVSQWKMEPLLADDADSALRIMKEAKQQGSPIKVTLLDAMMPRVDGFTLAESILNDISATSPMVIMLSSRDVNEDITRCREIGIKKYLSKPVGREELLEALLKSLGEQPPAPTADASNAPEIAHDFNARILLAEDNAINRQVAVKQLELLGYAVETVVNGKEAFEAVKRGGFDLVFMDVQMPEMDGLTAIRKIREWEADSGSRTPIVVLTAHAMKGDRDACLESGADGYLAKPLKRTELIETLGAMIKEDDRQPPREEASYLQELLDDLDGDVSIAKQLIGLWKTEKPDVHRQLIEAIDAGDANAAAGAAHMLGGSAGQDRATNVTAITRRMERSAREGDLKPVIAEMPALNRALDKLDKDIELFLRRC